MWQEHRSPSDTKIAKGPLESSSRGDGVGGGCRRIGGSSLPTGTVGEGPPDVSCEKYYLKSHAVGKRGKRGPSLRGGSYPVSSWVRFAASRETPASVQGVLGSTVSFWLYSVP